MRFVELLINAIVSLFATFCLSLVVEMREVDVLIIYFLLLNLMDVKVTFFGGKGNGND